MIRTSRRSRSPIGSTTEPTRGPPARSTTPCWRRCGWTPPTVRPRGPRPRGRCTPTCWSWAAASPGCGRRCARSSGTRDCRWCWSRRDRIAEHATGRNGGFCEASLTHGESNGRTRWPDEYDRAARARPAQPRRHRGDDRALRDRLRLRPRRHPRGRHPAARGAPPRPGRARLPRRRRRARPRRLPDVPRRAPRARRHGGRRPRAAGVGTGGRGGGARRPVARAHPRGLGPAPRRRCRGADGPGGHPGHPGRPGHQRLPQPAPAPALVGGPGLRLRAGDRAADRGPARRPAVGPQHRHLRLRQPVPLLPRDARPPDPVGRLRRDLPLRALDLRRARGPPGDLRGPRPQLRARPSPSCGGSASPTAGPGSSTPPPASAPSSGPPTAAGRRTPPASPASGSGPPASPPT